MTECVCDNCGHKQESEHYMEECPVCQEGFLTEIWLECTCGKAFGETHIDHAQQETPDMIEFQQVSTQNEPWDWCWEEDRSTHELLELMSYYELSAEELWNDAWYFFYVIGVDAKAPEGLTYISSSQKRWCYGSDSWDWTEYYRCPCGETLEFQSGT